MRKEALLCWRRLKEELVVETSWGEVVAVDNQMRLWLGTLALPQVRVGRESPTVLFWALHPDLSLGVRAHMSHAPSPLLSPMLPPMPSLIHNNNNRLHPGLSLLPTPFHPPPRLAAV